MNEYTHDRVQDLLFQYLDDQVSPRQRAGIEEHLATCRDCSRELETCRAANRAFSRVARRPLSEDFYARFEVALERQVHEPRAEESLGVSHSPSSLPPEPEAPSPSRVSPFPSRRTVSPWRFAVGVAAAFVLALGVILFLKGRQASLMLAGRLNEVAITRSGTNLPCDRAIALETYDRVTTGENSYAVFTVGKTGSVRIGPATQFIATSGTSLRVVHGQVWVQEGVDARLVVETRFATARPVGTVFNVEASDEATTVTVHDGTVEIATPSGQARPVRAGSRAVATTTGVLVENVGPEYLERPWVKWNQGLVVSPPAPGVILSGTTLEQPRTPEATTAPMEPAPLPDASGFPQGGASPFPPAGIPSMAPTTAPRAPHSLVRPSPAGGTPGPVSSPWQPGLGPSPASPGRDAAGGRGSDSSPGQGGGPGNVDHEKRSQGQGAGGNGPSTPGNPGGSGTGSGDSPSSGGGEGTGAGKGPGSSEGGAQGTPIYGPAPGVTPPSGGWQAPGGAAPVNPPVAPGGSAPSQPRPAAPSAPSNSGSAPGRSVPVVPANPGSAPGGSAPVAPSNPGSVPGGSAPVAPGSNPGGGSAPQGGGSGGRR